ncbi:MAG: type II secretion system protein [Bacilli bacterium]|nr:type II secretion system protein [Bacilli bacterium]
MKNKGFTLVELLAVIVVLAIILTIAVPNVIKIIDKAKTDSYERQKDLILDAAKKHVMVNEKDILWNENTAEIPLETLQNEGFLPNPVKDPRGGVFDSLETKIIVTRNNDKYTYELIVPNESVDSDYVIEKGVNKPKLVAGMTPIKWDDTEWVETNENDADWYSYDATNKKWANARTKDGSMWVWMPRYAYQIAEGYHTATTGTINIKFLKNTSDVASDGETIERDPTYDADKQTNYIVHPAFTFGADELTGIWVAKFEASNDNGNVKIVPGVTSWRTFSVGDSFDKCRAMETNLIYGWGDTGANIDTHLMKNIEWGAVAYLSKSEYGKETEITFNSSSYTGGGQDISYMSNEGQSTTGNIYGIYDMSGCGWERVAAYVDNGSSSLDNGTSILSAADKYRDVYIVTEDGQENNYNNASSKIGDAVCETSLSYEGSTSWFSDSSSMPSFNSPWFARGGHYAYGTNAGVFHFSGTDRDPVSSFRPVLLVGEGL